MNRKIVPVLFALGAVVLVSTQVNASPLFRFFEALGVAPTVPEVDFRDLGSVGIGTAWPAATWPARRI